MRHNASIRVLIVDTNCRLPRVLRRLLWREQDMSVIGECVGGCDAVAHVRALKPDVTLVALPMPAMDGLHTTLYLCRMQPNAKIILYSPYEEEIYEQQAKRFGASGYLVHDTVTNTLVEAIRIVHNGGEYFASCVDHPALQVA